MLAFVSTAELLAVSPPPELFPSSGSVIGTRV